MQDRDQLQEIEKIGEEDGLDEEMEERGGGGVSAVPVLQAVLCALALLALVFLKFTDQKTYSTVTEWYQSEAAQEIELPRWGADQPEASPSPTPGTVSSAPTLQMEGGALQRV